MMQVYRDAFVTNDLYWASATSIVITAITIIASLGLLGVLQSRAFGEDS